MAKRAKVTEPSEPEGEIVKVVDPLFDAPVPVETKLESQHAPGGTSKAAPSGPSLEERVRRFFEFLLRLAALLVILGIISLGLYYGLPRLYQRYILPVEQNTTQVMELQSRQEQVEGQLADLQTKLGTIESVQNQHDRLLTDMGELVSDIETEITARTQSLAALEQMQSKLQAQNEASSAALQRQIDLLKAMELLSRARLFMYQSNFGLAGQDVQIARDLLAKAQPESPEPLASELDAVLLRLDLTLSNLPDFPVAANDDLDIAWQILLSGLPQPTPTLRETPTPAGTPSPTLVATLTSTSQATLEPSATP